MSTSETAAVGKEVNFITPETASFLPTHLLKDHPDLVEGKIVTISPDSTPGNHKFSFIMALDGPGSAAVLSDPHYGLKGTLMFRDYMNALSWIAEGHGFSILGSAGDEMTIIGKTDFLGMVIFILEAQVEFATRLANYPEIADLIAKQKQVADPYIHAGGIAIAPPETNLGLAVFDLGGDRKQVATFGNSLAVKTMANRFIQTTALRGTGPIQEGDPVEITLAQKAFSVPSTLIETLEDPRVGLRIKTENSSNGSPLVQIDVPTGHDIHTALKNLREITGRKEITLPKQNLFGIPKIPGMTPEELAMFLPPHMREGWHPFPERLDPNKAEAIFYYIKGLEEFHLLLSEKIGRQNPEAIRIMGETARFIAHKVSKTLVKAGCNMKEVEFAADSTMKLISLVNVYQEFPDHPGHLPPNVLSSISESIRLLGDPETKADLIKYLLSKSPPLSESDLENLVNQVTFVGQVGVASCAADNLTCQVQEQERLIPYGSDQVGGPLISFAAREVSAMAHGEFIDRVAQPRIDLLKKRSFLTPEEDIELAQLSKLPPILEGSFIILQLDVAEKLNLVDPNDPNQAIIKDVRFRGFPKKVNLVALRPA